MKNHQHKKETNEQEPQIPLIPLPMDVIENATKRNLERNDSTYKLLFIIDKMGHFPLVVVSWLLIQ